MRYIVPAPAGAPAAPVLTPVAFFLCSFSQASGLLRMLPGPPQSKSALGGIKSWKNRGVK